MQHIPDTQVHEHLAALLLSRDVRTRDLDHATADSFRAEVRAPVVRAQVVHEGVVIYSETHGRISPPSTL
jgi:hypothetical protein